MAKKDLPKDFVKQAKKSHQQIVDGKTVEYKPPKGELIPNVVLAILLLIFMYVSTLL